MHPPRTKILWLLSAALVTGCAGPAATQPAPAPGTITAPGLPSTTATPPSGPLCTPAPSGTPTPCTQAEHDEQERLRPRYAAAEKVYREFNDLSAREIVAKKAEPSAELRALTTGGMRDYLAQERTSALAAATFSGDMRVSWMRPAALRSGEAGSLAMEACMDLSQWVVTLKDGQPGPAPARLERIVFDEAGGAPKVAAFDIVNDKACS